ncbi:hypothetical protein BBF93_03550 [Hyphomonas sp. CACIAM 19H1]|uniref:glycosyltransferase n=1 Tax=Hyphomonas sp. CACIAM 19H1 TaxID=1873716 RepID=UPI000DED6760|nr:glycosyltransferase [Hyphomonas sp. CACIAM 19H1]AXE63393.1 hypothetical protein BBF93_03550 [Hyphomonas sp. CACIAM 19H1]
MANDKVNELGFPVAEVGLTFTGERYTTVMGGEVELEHRHRYIFAMHYCKGKRVLDIASGEGYGSAMLAQVAEQVKGVDISEEAVRHAQKSYTTDNLEYICGSATAIPLDDHSVDVVVSFETIEHFIGHDKFISEIRRVLVPGGLLIMSSPNKEIYSTIHGNHNEFHVSELTKKEFRELLGSAFRNVRGLQQKATTGSLIVPEEGAQDAEFVDYRLLGGGRFDASRRHLSNGVYSILIASDAELPEVPEWGILEDSLLVGKLGEIIQYNEGMIRDLKGHLDGVGRELEDHRAVLIATLNEKDGIRAEFEEHRAVLIATLNERDEIRKEFEEHRAVLIATLDERDEIREHLEEHRAVLLATLRERDALRHSLEEYRAALEASSQALQTITDTNAAQQRRLAELEANLQHKEQVIAELYSSTSWRITAPVRRARLLAGRAKGKLKRSYRSGAALGKRAVNYLRARGVKQAFKALVTPGRVSEWVRLRHDPHAPSVPAEVHVGSAAVVAAPDKRFDVYAQPVVRPAGALMAPRVVISAELSIPQCAKYRVWQKVRHLESLGIPVQVFEWWRKDEVLKALQTASIAIFYRTPGYPEQIEVIQEAKRLGVITFWEVDDLIFDEPAYLTNSNLARLEPQLRASVLEGVPIYRSALQAVDYGIASTETIADYMRAAGVKDAFVVENCLDAETLAAAETIRKSRKPKEAGSPVRIVYGSGTKTHDVDFMLATPALANILRKNENVILEIIGELTISEALAPFESRIVRRPFSNFVDYLATLAGADISLAPLEPTLFSDAKSNIKYLEASVVGLPSVCSATRTFREVIRHGETGYLATNDEEWEQSLAALVADADLRLRVGKAALEAVLETYSPGYIAETQVRPILDQFNERDEDKLKVLVANVFYAPQSFGGATIVAEEVVKRLAHDVELDFLVVTSIGGEAAPYSFKRYHAKDVDCIGIKLPPMTDRMMNYQNLQMEAEFKTILEAYKPDVVHFHSIQEISASVADACRELNIPYVVTLHDAWWICERQFMVKGNDKYCFQKQIDLNVCLKCVPDFNFTVQRRIMLRQILDNAALLLTPSVFQRSLYLANGFDPQRVQVNKNGVRMSPPGKHRSVKGRKIRFGYVGGDHPVKGIQYLIRAFEGIPQERDFELCIVDNTLNLGFSSFETHKDRFPPNTVFLPAYNQETLDDFFDGIDVLMFPSQWKESFGLTVREALLRNVWVIATDGGGTAEDIVDGENGRIVPLAEDFDYLALRKAVLEILDNPEKLEGYENPYRERIVTFEQQAAQLKNYLKGVAESHKRLANHGDGSKIVENAGQELV